jgi:hypothetical protein
VPRDQMAVFLMRARALTELNSRAPTFSDVPQLVLGPTPDRAPLLSNEQRNSPAFSSLS